MPGKPDHSEDGDMLRIALTAALMVAEMEGELVPLPSPVDCVVDSEAAATVYFLAQARLSVDEAVAFIRRDGRRES